MISVGMGKFFAYFLTFLRMGEDVLWRMGSRRKPCESVHAPSLVDISVDKY